MEKLTAVGFAQLWKEAEQGNAEAQFMLAGALYNGNGRQRDPTEGARWLLRAAEQGYAPAQCVSAPCTSKATASNRTTARQ
jgi:TPR repeat protein